MKVEGKSAWSNLSRVTPEGECIFIVWPSETREVVIHGPADTCVSSQETVFMTLSLIDCIFHHNWFYILALVNSVFTFFRIASFGSLKTLVISFYFSPIKGLCYWCCWKEWFFLFPLLLFYQWSFITFLWRICPQTTLHLDLAVIALFRHRA